MFVKSYGKQFIRPWEDFVYLPVNGTVPSGDAVKTSLCNTMRSLLYVWFYFEDGLGIQEPWL